jgi:hypothetical protein
MLLLEPTRFLLLAPELPEPPLLEQLLLALLLELPLSALPAF